MRLRKVKNAKEKLEQSPYFINSPEQYKGKYSEVFQNDFPIHLEIGMGKGTFLIEMAKTFPNINFIGVEKYDSVLIRAIEKVGVLNLKNIKLMCYDAESQSSNDVRARLANFLLLFMQSSDYRSLGYVPFSQSELASAIGASRIQIARVCGALKQEGVIQVGKRQLRVLDLERLRQSASYQGFS